MASDLLATKLRIPPQAHYVVRRDRLISALEEGIPRHKLSLLSAPAGYGKTTLLADWARVSSLPVAWLSLGEEDNDIELFLRYLLAAWEHAQPGVSDSPLGILLGAMMPDQDAVLTAAINLASERGSQVAFVLDDYHLIDDADIHESLTFLLDHLPPTVHVVLAGRGEPPLPLARYRARRELLELDTADLRFANEEADAFLNQQMGLDLAGETIASVNAQLEGWIAGTQMLALTLRRRPRPPEEIVVSARHRFITDYLSQDVLGQLPADLRDFLLRTSILERLSGPLCDAVTGEANGQAMLETLERENLFLVPLDDNREWYRYHRLFAEFLREELQRDRPAEVAGLHQRAAGWYLEHELPESAFDHAVAGDDRDLVVQILERYESSKLHGGEFSVVQRWVDAIPEEWHADNPMFGLARAGLLAFTGSLEDVVRCVDDIELRLTTSGAEATRWQLAQIAAYRCFVACFLNDLTQAELFAGRALRDLRDEDLTYRVDVYHALGDTYRRNGRWGDAKAAYLSVLDLTQPPVGHLQSAHVFGALADLELRQGRLRRAAGYWRKALAAIQEPENWGRLPLPVTGWVHIRLAESLYEWNELADARNHLSHGLERAELGGDVRSMIAGYLLAARIRLTEGNTTAAAESLDQARMLVDEAPFPDWLARFERLQLELWLAQGRLRAAVDWSDGLPHVETPAQRPEPEIGQLAIARVLIVRGDPASTERALALLDPLIGQSEADGRKGVEIEALLLEALAHWRRGERAGALPPLEHALRLSEPEGYLRLFADFGAPVVRLLQEARARGVMRGYIDSILAACAGAARTSGDRRALPEPLTDREMEILGLIAAGLTNREIADRLSISAETVKKHSGNIYSKLGARTRTEAVSRARQLELLG